MATAGEGLALGNGLGGTKPKQNPTPVPPGKTGNEDRAEDGAEL